MPSPDVLAVNVALTYLVGSPINKSTVTIPAPTLVLNLQPRVPRNTTHHTHRYSVTNIHNE
jgi:hypothetical protein